MIMPDLIPAETTPVGPVADEVARWRRRALDAEARIRSLELVLAIAEAEMRRTMVALSGLGHVCERVSAALAPESP
jgi:hypothetical protein